MSGEESTLTLDDVPIAIVLLDPHHRVLEVNAAFLALLGCAQAPLGRRLRDVLGAAGAVAADGDFGKGFRLSRDGADRSFRLSLHPRGAGAMAILTDVTPPRVAIEHHLVGDDVRARLMHDAEIGTWRYDPDLDTYYISTELSLGHRDIGKPVPRAMLQLIQHQEDRAKDDAIRERITREGGFAEAEMRYLSADGGWNHLRVLYRSGAQLPSGLYEMFGVSLSITSLAQARDEARTSAKRLGLALKASRGGVFEYDFKKRTFWATPQLAQLVGRDLLSRANEADPFEIFHPEDRAAAVALRDQANVRAVEPLDLRLDRGDGERWVRLYLEVEHDGEGRPSRGVGLMIDIDEAKRQALAVGEARRIAEEATAAKSDFLASVSHEIRTPMNGVVGVLNLLRREPLSDVGRKLLAEALGCSEMLSQLINDVLDFSKIEAGLLNVTTAPTDAAAIVESVANLLRPQAEDKGLFLSLDTAAATGWHQVDPVRLRQCLFNVIGNAVKFTEAGGVAVRALTLGDGADRKLRVEVEDTGIGVPEAARSRLFGRFQQAESGPSRRFGGTGLGLAISRQLARMMGGDLDYDSCEGRGSIFWFEIAAPAVEPPKIAPPAESDLAPLAGLRILIVDDNRVNRLIAALSIEALGAETVAAGSGAAAIEAAAGSVFDVILMDVNMPGMDGLEATRRIRALAGGGAKAPVLALTADVMRQQQQAYLAAGMNGVVPKPFSPAQLLSEIVRVCEGRA
ncbi:MAG TPA: ATP-binding protein, partial [Caulobacter sp.]|nr:ATP-binding protein [Caulobacter sp.]